MTRHAAENSLSPSWWVGLSPVEFYRMIRLRAEYYARQKTSSGDLAYLAWRDEWDLWRVRKDGQINAHL